MKRHLLGDGKSIEATLSDQELADVLGFIRGIEQTETVDYDTDRFLR
jgi:hypothetical protein